MQCAGCATSSARSRRGLLDAARLQLEEHLVLFIMPSSERARSSIASEPVFRSRTSASSASLRALSFALASRCAASCRSSSRTCSQPPLPSHIGYCSASDQDDEDEGEPAHASRRG